MSQPFDADSQNLPQRLVAALSRIGLVLKSRAWQEAGARGLTPTQGQILAVLRRHASCVRLSNLAEELGVSLPTASDALSTLVVKGFVRKERSAEDGRALQVQLTPSGIEEAERAASWSSFLLNAVGQLEGEEQSAFLRGLIKVLHSLEQQGVVAPQRMCINCRYFNAEEYGCALLGARLEAKDLRIDCPDAQLAAGADREKAWKAFLEKAPLGSPS